MEKFRRYLKGSSPGIYKVVGFMIKRATKYGYLPIKMKLSNEKPLSFSAELAMVTVIDGTIRESIKRYLWDQPSRYSVLGYNYFKIGNEPRMEIKVSEDDRPLSFMPMLKDMVRIAM